MKSIKVALPCLKLLLFPLLLAQAETRPVLRLWPGTAPGETVSLPPEEDTTKLKDGLVANRRVIRLGNVSEPTITVYRPPVDLDTGTAVVVCPGGGYHILAMDLEGTEVCEWLNSIGVTGVLLKYRVPSRAGQEKHAAALQDVQRALGMVRSRAEEWRLNPQRIGVLGFSAGGHLAAAASTIYQHRTYAETDAADKVSCRPDFALLIYPGYLAQEKNQDALAPELAINKETPPTFLVMTQDDPVRPENVLVYTLALKRAGVPAELHLYPTGGHGYGLRATDQPVTHWPVLAAAWMEKRGLLKK